MKVSKVIFTDEQLLHTPVLILYYLYYQYYKSSTENFKIKL